MCDVAITDNPVEACKLSEQAGGDDMLCPRLAA